MEEMPKTEKPISPEEFFANKIETYRVTKENFFKLVKERNPSMDDNRILQANGVNLEINNKIVILLRTDIYPEKYLPYLETHEKWEAYIARKNGYNLWDKSTREYKNDKGINDFDEETLKEFAKDIGSYNYDFRHEYAILKEYQQALEDGNLDEFHNWLMELRRTKKEEASESGLRVIENDTKIRESIYKKLKQNTKHYFNRN